MPLTHRLLGVFFLLSAGMMAVGRYLEDVAPTPDRDAVVRVLEPSREAQAARYRVEAKTEVAAALIRGEIGLFDAAALFRQINCEPYESPATMWRLLPGSSDNEKVCRQVIYWVGGQLVGRRSDEEVKEVVRQLEEELSQHLAGHGAVVLPGWGPGT